MQAIIQLSSAVRRCPGCFALGGAGVISAGTVLWYGGAKALLVGAVALAALALVVCAVKAWKQRSMNSTKSADLNLPKPTDFVDHSKSRGIIHWEMKLRNVVVVIQEREQSNALYVPIARQMRNIDLLKNDGISSVKNILVGKPEPCREENDPRRLILALVPTSRSFGVLESGVDKIFTAVKEFVAEGGDVDKITVLIPDLSSYSEGKIKKPTPQILGL